MTLEAIETEANTLAPKRSADLNFGIIEALVDDIVTVSDDAMRDAALRRLWLRRLVAGWQDGTLAAPTELNLAEPSSSSDGSYDDDDDDYHEGGGRGRDKGKGKKKKQKKFHCPGCGGDYSTKYYLQMHMRETCKGEEARTAREAARAKREAKQQRAP